MKSFVLQKISNHGTSNPIVARLSLQTLDMLQWTGISEDKKKKIIELYLMEMQPKLLRCYDILQAIHQQRDTALNEMITAARNGSNSIPYIIDLNENVSSFLQAARLYLIGVLQTLNAFFDTKFHEANALKAQRDQRNDVQVWAENNLGVDHPIAKTVAAHSMWMADIITSRNAVEHPNGNSGKLVIENYRGGPGGIQPPSWRREGKQAREARLLLPDLQEIVRCLLEFGENILAFSVQAHPVEALGPAQIHEIPESQRDPQKPVRLQGIVYLKLPEAGA